MAKYYLIVFLRLFRKEKLYAIINVLGLSIGLGAVIVIGLFTYSELIFDQFHENSDRIYRIGIKVKGRYEKVTLARGLAPLAYHLVESVPQIKRATRVHPISGGQLFQYRSTASYEDGIYSVDSSFFSIFSFDLLNGSPGYVLAEPNTIVITERMAQKLFGDDEAMGEIITLDNNITLKVTGIAKNPPENSHLQFNYLISNRTFDEPGWENNWDNLSYIYVETDRHLSESRLGEFISEYLPREFYEQNESNIPEVHVIPLGKIYLYGRFPDEIGPQGNIHYIFALTIIGSIILFISIFNYFNLTISRASSRVKEIGLCKIFGASKSLLLRRYLLESALWTLFALLLSLLIVYLVLPYFNHMINKQLTFDFTMVQTYSFLLGLWVLTALFCGAAPALYLDSVSPVRALKGLILSTKGTLVKKLLVFFQLMISIILVAVSIVVYGQFKYMQNRDLGFRKEQQLIIEAPDELSKVARIFKQGVEEVSGVKSVTISTSVPGKPSWAWSLVDGDVEGPQGRGAIILDFIKIDPDFLETYDMELLAGRNFSDELASDSSSSIIINESAAKIFGWTDPLGKWISIDREVKCNVVGVVRDFHNKSVEHKIDPLMMMYSYQDPDFFTVKLETGNIRQVLLSIEDIWNKHVQERPFDYYFLDDYFDRLYTNERMTSNVVSLFTALAILITLAGLFGLISYIAEQKTREIGIRKVYGASLSDINMHLSKSFLKLAFLAFIVATPISLVLLRRWLQSYAYRVEPSIQIYLAILVGVSFLIWMVVFYHTYRAGRTNPINAIRSLQNI